MLSLTVLFLIAFRTAFSSGVPTDVPVEVLTDVLTDVPADVPADVPVLSIRSFVALSSASLPVEVLRLLDWLPPDCLLPGALPLGSRSPGALPLGSRSPGALPLGSLSPGALPVGSLSPGALPVGEVLLPGALLTVLSSGIRLLHPAQSELAELRLPSALSQVPHALSASFRRTHLPQMQDLPSQAA